MQNKTAQWLIRAFYWLFAVVIFLCVLLCLLQGTRLQDTATVSVQAPLLAVCVLLWIGALLLGGRLIARIEPFWKRHETILLCAVLLVLGVLFFACARAMAIALLYDARYVYDGACHMAQTGALGDELWYFYRYQNNASPMLFLAAAIWLGARFGLNALLSAHVATVLCTVVAVFFVYRIGKLLASLQAGLYGLMLCFFCLPLYFFCAIPYTDTLALPFAAGCIYLYLQAKQTEVQWQRYLLLTGAGLLLGIGGGIKPTVFIAAVAILLDWLLHGAAKKLFVPLACCAAVCVVFTLGQNAFITTYVLDRQKAAEAEIPLTHWVMMGLRPEGIFNEEDEAFTLAQPNANARKEAVNTELWRRVSEKSVQDWLLWAKTKLTVIAGDGTFFVGSQLDDEVLHPNFMHGIVIAGRPHYTEFYYACTSFYLACLLLASADALRDKSAALLPVRLSYFGLLLFLLFWEASPRYLYHYVPLLLVCAAVAFARWPKKLRSR